MSPEAEARSIRGKENRSKLTVLHTSGSKSYARVAYELAEQLGHPARRDELFITTHTQKNGDPTTEAQPFIEQLKNAAADHPELMEKSIQEGDLYAHVFGEKEPKGRVRQIGLGPTPQDVGTPGTRGKMPTRIQMEIELRQYAEQQYTDLNNRLDELQKQMINMQESLAQGRHNVETTNSNHGSNSRHVGKGSEEPDDVEQYEDEDVIIHKKAAPIKVLPRKSTSPPTNNVTSCNEDERLLRGREVILYAIMRVNIPVAKGTILSTVPTSLVGGQPLGREYCDIFINTVLKRDAMLPRPYDGMETMADAHLHSIAWPLKKLKATKK